MWQRSPVHPATPKPTTLQNCDKFSRCQTCLQSCKRIWASSRQIIQEYITNNPRYHPVVRAAAFATFFICTYKTLARGLGDGMAMTNLCLWTVAWSWLGVVHSQYHWIGGVTNDLATISTQGFAGSSFALLECDIQPCTSKEQISITSEYQKIPLTNLKAKTLYTYTIAGHQGSFKTFPEPGTPHSFKFGFGSCVYVSSRTPATELPIWDELGEKGIDLFIHGGDINYEDITKNDPHLYLNAFQLSLANEKMQVRLSSLFLSACVPVLLVPGKYLYVRRVFLT